jgi:hypothetical protein
MFAARALEGLAGVHLLLSLTLKRRVLYAGLLLFTLWPLAHMYLATHFQVSPWKLAGWGMYATPRPSFVQMAVFGRRPDRREFEGLTSIPAPCQEQARLFLSGERWLGQLIRPDELARSLRKQMPAFADLRIITGVPTLDRETGMIIVKQVEYEYPASKHIR